MWVCGPNSGRARQAKGRQYYVGDVNLPAFLTAQNLKPFIPNELYVTSSQIEFRCLISTISRSTQNAGWHTAHFLLTAAAIKARRDAIV